MLTKVGERNAGLQNRAISLLLLTLREALGEQENYGGQSAGVAAESIERLVDLRAERAMDLLETASGSQRYAEKLRHAAASALIKLQMFKGEFDLSGARRLTDGGWKNQQLVGHTDGRDMIGLPELGAAIPNLARVRPDEADHANLN